MSADGRDEAEATGEPDSPTPSAGLDSDDEPEIVTMVDVLKEETELEENADAGLLPPRAVLGLTPLFLHHRRRRGHRSPGQLG